MNSHKYDIAFSFAGEDRQTVRRLADYLKERGVRVFFDEYEKASLWGVNLYDHFADVFENQAQYCVIFLSRHYTQKFWTTFERQAAQARAFRERREYILPVRLDDALIQGFFSTVNYVFWTEASPEDITELILQKLQRLRVSAVPSSNYVNFSGTAVVGQHTNSLPEGYSVLSFREGSGGLPGNGEFVRGTEHETVTVSGKKPYYDFTLLLPFPVGRNGLTIAFFPEPHFDIQNYFNLQLNLSNLKVNEKIDESSGKVPYLPGGTGSFVMSRVWLNGIGGIAFDISKMFFENIVCNNKNKKPNDGIFDEKMYLNGFSLSSPETNESISVFDSVLIAHGHNRLPEENNLIGY